MKLRGFATRPAPPERRCTARVTGRVNEGAQCQEWGKPREDGQLRCHQHQHDQPHTARGSGSYGHRFPPEVIAAFLADVRAACASIDVSLDSRTWTADDKWVMREQGITVAHLARKHGISTPYAHELVRAAAGNPRHQRETRRRQRRQALLAQITEAVQKLEVRLQRKRDECAALEARLAGARAKRRALIAQLDGTIKEAA